MSQSAKRLRQYRQQNSSQNDTDGAPHPAQNHNHYHIHRTEKVESFRRDEGLEMSIQRTGHAGKYRHQKQRQDEVL